jgi:3-oxoacyl-[acyl-carrier protein] reductase
MRETNLAGKVALVTGASSGIGRAAAIALAERGASVAIGFHRNEDGAAETTRLINDNGSRCVAFQADVTRSSAVRDTVDSVVSEFGPIDILVNNAGSLIERLRILELREELWDEAMALNLKSAYLFSQAVASAMMERKSGCIINIASLAGRNGGALGSIHYATSKGGLIAFTKGLAKEMAPYGVRVNAINPGIIDTPFQAQFSSEEAMRNFKSSTPLGRIGNPQEIGSVVAFLASDESSFIVGETIEVNGGIFMD